MNAGSDSGQDAFFLKSSPLTDHQLLVDVFSREHGLLRGILRLGKKDFNHSALVPLNLWSVKITGKEQAALKRFQVHQVSRQLYDVSSSYAALCLLQHWAHLIAQCQAPGQLDSRVFRLLDHVTDFLLVNHETSRFFAMNLYLEWWLLVLSGAFPAIQDVREIECLPDGGFYVKKGNSLIPTNTKCSENDLSLLVDCFKQRIEVFVGNAIQYQRPDCLFEASGFLWDGLLDKKIHTRTTLLSCLREKGF